MVSITFCQVPDFQGRTVVIEFGSHGPPFIKLTAAEYNQLAREVARIDREAAE